MTSAGNEAFIFINSDRGWRGRVAGIRHADLLMGERHDLTLEPEGWDVAGLDDAGWRDVECRERADPQR